MRNHHKNHDFSHKICVKRSDPLPATTQKETWKSKDRAQINVETSLTPGPRRSRNELGYTFIITATEKTYCKRINQFKTKSATSSTWAQLNSSTVQWRTRPPVLRSKGSQIGVKGGMLALGHYIGGEDRLGLGLPEWPVGWWNNFYYSLMDQIYWAHTLCTGREARRLSSRVSLVRQRWLQRRKSEKLHVFRELACRAKA